jgi:hypothetical protein
LGWPESPGSAWRGMARPAGWGKVMHVGPSRQGRPGRGQSGPIGYVSAGFGQAGWARPGMAGFGQAVQVRLGMAGPGLAWQGGSGKSGPGTAGQPWPVGTWYVRREEKKCECPRNTGRHGAAARRRPSRQVWVGRGRGGKACSGPVRRGRPGVTWSGQGVARSGRHGPVRYVLTRPGRRGVARHDRARSGAADRVCHGGARPDQATRFSPVRPAGLV